MKKRKKVVFGIFLSLFLSGCLTTQKSLMSIEKGMNRKDVISLLGEPSYRRFNKNTEEWEYHKKINLGNDEKVIIIQFLSNKVSSLNSYKVNAIDPMGYYFQGYDYSSHNYQNNSIDILFYKIKKEPFKDKKISILKRGISNKKITCKQCIRLLNLVSFGDEKLEYLQIIIPSIIDRENYNKVIRSLPINCWEKAEKLLLKE